MVLNAKLFTEGTDNEIIEQMKGLPDQLIRKFCVY